MWYVVSLILLATGVILHGPLAIAMVAGAVVVFCWGILVDGVKEQDDNR